MAVNIGTNPVKELFVGNMGIKEVFLGNESFYERPGGYFYLVLDTTTEKENTNG